jgi:hypothetical protein
VGVTTTQTTIRGLALTGLDLRAPVHFSPNGRYALVEQEKNIISQPAAIIDLATGHRTTLGSLYRDNGPGVIVTDSGSVVWADGWVHISDRAGNRATLTDLLQEDATSAVTDRSGSVIVYTSRWHYPHAAFSRIRVVDPYHACPANAYRRFRRLLPTGAQRRWPARSVFDHFAL